MYFIAQADAVANDPDAEMADEDIEPDLPPPPHLLDETQESELTGEETVNAVCFCVDWVVSVFWIGCLSETETERDVETVMRGRAPAERPRRGRTSRQHSRAFVREAERELEQVA